MVIAILSILAAILLPVLGKAKLAAQKTVCINNLKQIQLAWGLYPEDSNEKLVINGEDDGTVGQYGLNYIPPSWVNGVMQHDNTTETAKHLSTNTIFLVDRRYALFAPYIGSAATYKCPSDHAVVRGAKQNFQNARSYAMNMYAGWWGGRVTWNGSQWRDIPVYRYDLNPGFFNTVADMRQFNPSRIWILIDEHPDTIWGAAFYEGIGTTMNWTHIPASRHNGSGVLSFADGHVEGKKWLDAGTKKPVTGRRHYGGDPAYAPRDKPWLNERSTKFIVP